MNSARYLRSFPKLDKLRFWMSCKLYKNPVLLPAAFLLLGGLGGAFAHTVRADATDVQAATVVDAKAQATDAHIARQDQTLRALAIELSRLQARADRLDTLGKQWVDEAGLEHAGFDFGEDPGQGGGDLDEQTGEALSVSMIASDMQKMQQQYDLLEKQLAILDHWEETVEEIAPGAAYASPGGRYQTSGFGGRYDPFGRGKRFHAGIDLAARVGDPVMAMAPGKVVFAGWKGAYGKLVEIQHEDGYRTRYAHNSSITVRVGQRVDTGVVIAKAGSTGRSTGAHLHIEVLANGRQVNPRPFLERGRRLAIEQRKLMSKLEKVKREAAPTS